MSKLNLDKEDKYEEIQDEKLRLILQVNAILMTGDPMNESEVNHQITCHSDTVHLCYRDAAKRIEKSLELLQAYLQKEMSW